MIRIYCCFFSFRPPARRGLRPGGTKLRKMQSGMAGKERGLGKRQRSEDGKKIEDEKVRGLEQPGWRLRRWMDGKVGCSHFTL
jgi:hypothetical protein